MNVCSHVTEPVTLSEAVSVWFSQAAQGRMYLMSDIMNEICGIDAESKDGQRLSPLIGRQLSNHGMINKRMRGPQGNRHYWIKK